MTQHYLDYNATAPLCEAAKEAIQEGMALVGNASSVHQFGRRIRQKIEEARTEIAGYFKAKPADVIFTSGATEANHLALCGFRGRVVVSAIEHDSVDQARDDRVVCPVNDHGIADLAALDNILKEQNVPTLISVMAANNETGVVQPLDQVIDLAQQYGAHVHCDATQAVGRIECPWEKLDLISFSAHKLGGPQGVGALIKRADISLQAQLRGGGQERSLRSGTENFLGILGFGKALMKARNVDWDRVKAMRDSLEVRLKTACPDVVFLAQNAPRLPNTSVFVMKGVKSATQVMNFDLKGMAVSAGSACSSGKVKSSQVLAAMGIPPTLADCAIRVSIGPDNTPDFIEPFVQAWGDIYRRAQGEQGEMEGQKQYA